MTQAKKLKRAVRARARKTGESYASARRQVLAVRARREARTAPSSVGGASGAAPAAAPAAAALKGRPSPTPAKGAVSDARVRALTGHGLDHWFELLDGWGAGTKGHTAAARHLHEQHGISGWYAQGITVAYERARGVRALNQRCDGKFEVSVSKAVAAPVADVAAAFAQPARRRRWLSAAPELLAALEAGLAAPRCKGVRVRDGKDARLRYSGDGVTVDVRIDPKAGGKTSVVAQSLELPDAAAVETHRAAWRKAFESLKAMVE